MQQCLKDVYERRVSWEIRGGKNSVACNWHLLAKKYSMKFAETKFLDCLSNDCREVVQVVALAGELLEFVSEKTQKDSLEGLFSFSRA